MSNPSKAKGTAQETRVVQYLREHGFVSAHRKPLTGNRDQGDIQVTPWTIAEVKAHKTWSRSDIETWLDQTETERVNAKQLGAVLIVVNYRKTLDVAWAVQRNTRGFPVFEYLEDWCRDHSR